MRSRDRDFQNEWEICLCDYLHWTSRSVDVLGCELDERFIQFVRQLLADGRTAEGWSREVTEDIAAALLERDASEGDPSESAKTFVRAY